jgi:molybdenum cofactor cytidylyltransferase
MQFGPVPTATAVGAILAHSVRLPDRSMRKGRLLSDEDVKALAAAGYAKVTVARLEADDVPEDEAATRLAAAAGGDGAVRQAAFTGRCNLYAEAAGIVVLDRARLDRINLIDEAITIATVAPFDLVQDGQMVATVKVIPFAAPRLALDEAERIAAEAGPLLRVVRLRPHRAGLIMTTLAGTKASVLDKTATVLTERLTHLGSELARQDRCAHKADDIAPLIRDQHAAGCSPILIFGASAITDRRDEIPAGIETAGGVVEHFGMPVDPGNLLLLGRYEGVPVVGLPGCARSPKLNGFDWVLQRLLAGLPVGRCEIMQMGAGGLLTEIPTRGQPRAGDEPSTALKAPRIAVLVLAAGQSRRMGSANKLLAEVDGQPMVTRAVDTALAAQAASVTVVLGHQADAVRETLAGRDVACVVNPDYAAGLSTSLKAGLLTLTGAWDAVLVMLGDMPRVTPAHLNKLIAAFNPLEGRAICVPTYNGKRGNPVLFSREFLAELATAAGDTGAKHLIGAHEDRVCEVAMPDDGVLFDVDTPAALSAVRDSA